MNFKHLTVSFPSENSVHNVDDPWYIVLQLYLCLHMCNWPIFKKKKKDLHMSNVSVYVCLVLDP